MGNAEVVAEEAEIVRERVARLLTGNHTNRPFIGAASCQTDPMVERGFDPPRDQAARRAEQA